MSRRLLFALTFAAALSTPTSAQPPPPRTTERLRRIILHSRHLGAHGLGYNSNSLTELARNLTSADVPNLLLLLEDRNRLDLHVGTQFALASQCSAALEPTRNQALDHKINFLSAQDVVSLMASFEGCSPEVRGRASAVRKELDDAFHAEMARRQQESQRLAAEDRTRPGERVEAAGSSASKKHDARRA